MADKVYSFGAQNTIDWKKYAAEHKRFSFVNPFILDDTGNIEALADALEVKVDDLKNNPGIKITAKYVKINKDHPITLINVGYYYTTIEINGLRLDLLIVPDEYEPIDVILLDECA